MAVYLLHFDNPGFYAAHYIGFSKQVPVRFEQHLMGKGSQMTRKMHEQAKEPVLAHVWPEGTLTFEAFLQHLVKSNPKYRNVHLWCPVCGVCRFPLLYPKPGTKQAENQAVWGDSWDDVPPSTRFEL